MSECAPNIWEIRTKDHLLSVSSQASVKKWKGMKLPCARRAVKEASGVRGVFLGSQIKDMRGKSEKMSRD